MAQYNGQLNANEIFGTIFNMIISQQVYADNIKGTYSELVDMMREDGTLYGDTKLYYATDALKSFAWGGDAEASKLLELDRPEDPDVQAITIDKFRQIRLTVDNYLTKRAWRDENAFGQFNSVMLTWLGDTKKIYDATTVNSFIGTHETNKGRQEVTITLPSVEGNPESENRLQAQTIAQELADLAVEVKDISRDFNDYGNLRSYSKDELMLVMNSDFYNKILKIDLPTIFHKDGLNDEFKTVVLPSRYFGKINTANGTTTGTNLTVRSLVEKDYGDVHCFPGDLLPNNTAYVANETYTEDHTIIGKVIYKKAVPYMSGFEARTIFVNPRSLTENNYLTFGHNTLQHLADKPFITIRGNKA